MLSEFSEDYSQRNLINERTEAVREKRRFRPEADSFIVADEIKIRISPPPPDERKTPEPAST